MSTMIEIRPIYKSDSYLKFAVSALPNDTVTDIQTKNREALEHGRMLRSMGVPFIVVDSVLNVISGTKWLNAGA